VGRRAGMTWRATGALSAVALTIFVAGAAAAAPAVTTGPTTAVGGTSATVTGAVDPGGKSTTWWVEYGTTTAYGSRTSSSTSAGSGTAAVDVSANLTGLKTGTTYHYRLVATNGDGTTHGGDAVFTTLTPPVAVTGSASGISASSATLNGTVDANGRATTYYFEYGSSTSYGTKTAAKSAGSATNAQPVSTGISGLQAGHTFHFRLVATSDAGTSVGKDATFTTSAAPAVATGDVSSVAPTSATLHGTVTPNGLSTSWWFEYGTTTSYGSKTSSQSAGSGTSARSVSATVRSLRVGTTYHYRLVAQNSSGRTVGEDRMFSTTGPPSAQTGAAQSVAADSATLTGSLDTHGRSTTWWFDYGTTTSYGKSTASHSAGSRAGAQSVSTALTGLAAATTYHYRLVAKSDAGTTRGADATFTTSGVSLTTLARDVVYGGRVRLTGVVPTRRANEQVVVFVQAYGEGSFHSVATVLTGTDGTWNYLVQPQIATAYQASWRGGMSTPLTIAVHPRITLTRTRTGHFLTRVVAGRGFAYRVVQLQRLRNGRWVTIKRVRLGAHSRVEFRATLPKGRSTVRIAFSVNQAGAGYLGGASHALTVTIKR
jgi:phosphodiesterase/alkaline phosphatase D-like protein